MESKYYNKAVEILGDELFSKEDIDKLSEFYENCIGMYTKEQVEELLEKQRELCSKKVCFFNSSSEVKNSILNAKLKLE